MSDQVEVAATLSVRNLKTHFFTKATIRRPSISRRERRREYALYAVRSVEQAADL